MRHDNAPISIVSPKALTCVKRPIVVRNRCWSGICAELNLSSASERAGPEIALGIVLALAWSIARLRPATVPTSPDPRGRAA